MSAQCTSFALNLKLTPLPKDPLTTNVCCMCSVVYPQPYLQVVSIIYSLNAVTLELFLRFKISSVSLLM